MALHGRLILHFRGIHTREKAFTCIMHVFPRGTDIQVGRALVRIQGSGCSDLIDGMAADN